LVKEMENADLVLVLGTTLAGMSADLLAHKANKSPTKLGSVMINLQQTQYDGEMTLKIQESMDIVLVRLLDHLGLGKCVAAGGECWEREENGYMYDDSSLKWRLLVAPLSPSPTQSPTQFIKPPTASCSVPTTLSTHVPYDADGNPSKRGTLWDLSEGKMMRLHKSHNWVGADSTRGISARDVLYMRIGAPNPKTCGFNVEVGLFDGGEFEVISKRSLGFWYLHEAKAGTLAHLPAMNSLQ
jgi:hypothetical protein